MGKVGKALRSWEELNRVLKTMTESQLEEALEKEKASEAPRKEHLLRLHRRLGVLRRERERKELMGVK